MSTAPAEHVVLFCMPNMTHCILFVSGMSSSRHRLSVSSIHSLLEDSKWGLPETIARAAAAADAAAAPGGSDLESWGATGKGASDQPPCSARERAV
jgi:hypothetical protein